MEDMKSLLIMVLHKIFHDRPKIVEDTYQLIYSYNSGKREQKDYEKTLKTICDLMNDEVPSEMLVYLLTLVDMPLEQGGNFCPIMEKLQKTHPCLTENVRPKMLEFLSTKKQVNDKNTVPDPVDDEITLIETNQSCDLTTATVMTEEKEKNGTISEPQKQDTVGDKKTFVKPATKRSKSKRKIGQSASEYCNKQQNESVKTLLDITANYVVKNEQKLNQIYKSRLKQAWKIINSNLYSGDTLNQCYKAVRDLNKKTKLLRCIENDNITEDILMEEYENSEIFLKECNMPEYDPFEVSDECMTIIKNFVAACD